MDDRLADVAASVAGKLPVENANPLALPALTAAAAPVGSASPFAELHGVKRAGPGGASPWTRLDVANKKGRFDTVVKVQYGPIEDGKPAVAAAQEAVNAVVGVLWSDTIAPTRLVPGFDNVIEMKFRSMAKAMVFVKGVEGAEHKMFRSKLALLATDE
ncbi:hypothetical protein BDZ89DRAFT_1160518 [Hymenopellis radicata]|nr:hypothetical protein BDZ89DRAFT_1160518 [Hymenopellis radicata]